MIQIADNNQIVLNGEYSKYYLVQHPDKTTVYTYADIDMPRARYTTSTPDGQAELERDIRALMAAPAPSYPTGVEAEVCAEIARRQAEGHRKYGTTVADADLTTAEWLQHLKEELLDAAIYAHRALQDVSPAQAPKECRQG